METNIPPNNFKTYCLLYSIEISLRELIIESFEKIDGPKWYKKRLPNDILNEKYIPSRNFERKITWTDFISHHPIYYIDFPDLKKIIERGDNWNDLFKNIFSKKEIIIGILVEIESIRNKIAHNRKVTEKDYLIIKKDYYQIEEFIGREKVIELTNKCTYKDDIKTLIKTLHTLIHLNYKKMKDYDSLCDIDKVSEIVNSWWFDETYLGQSIDNIINIFKCFKSYISFPRKRGSGYFIEEWIKKEKIDKLFEEAEKEFDILMR